VNVETPVVVPELDATAALPELSAGERHRLAQREAEEAERMGYLPRVLHAGNAEVPPLLRTPSGACYAMKVHQRMVRHGEKLVRVESSQLVRVDRAPKSKKERRALRAAAKARAAAAALEAGAHQESGS
jgi:hypothetical protein